MITISLIREKLDLKLPIITYSLLIGIALSMCMFGFVIVSNSLENEVAAFKAQKNVYEMRLAGFVKEKKQIRELKEKSSRLEKLLVTIDLLKARKKGPVRLLYALAKAVPEKGWLTSIEQKEGKMEIFGVAVDLQTIALFMRELQERKEFETIELLHAKDFRYEETDLQEFALLAHLSPGVGGKLSSINNYENKSKHGTFMETIHSLKSRERKISEAGS